MTTGTQGPATWTLWRTPAAVLMALTAFAATQAAAAEKVLVDGEKTSAHLGIPYDPARHGGGPFQRNLEIVSLAVKSGLHVFWVDQESKAAKNARGYCMSVQKNGSQYVAGNSFGVELLHSLLGFTMDERGCFYVATGLVEAPESLPKPSTYRNNVVNILKLSPQGKLLLTIDVQKEMQKADPKTTIIQDPGTHGWSSSRLAYGNGTLHIVFGVSWTNGHQGACAAQFDSTTGSVVRLGSTYCSHCMDQRLVWDGTMFQELLMGDTYPRAFVMGRYFRKKSTRALELFNPKAGRQQHSFMGNMAATSDPMFGYLANFAAEKSADADSYHELAVVRIRTAGGRLDSNPATKSYLDQTFAKQNVKVEDKAFTNYVKWMTDTSKEKLHVARPKLVRVDTDRFVMLWEKWAGEPGEHLSSYSGTYGMVIDSKANIVAPEKKLADIQLVTGDDGAYFSGKAVFVSGNAVTRSVRFLCVDKENNVECFELPACPSPSETK